MIIYFLRLEVCIESDCLTGSGRFHCCLYYFFWCMHLTSTHNPPPRSSGSQNGRRDDSSVSLVFLFFIFCLEEKPCLVQNSSPKATEKSFSLPFSERSRQPTSRFLFSFVLQFGICQKLDHCIKVLGIGFDLLFWLLLFSSLFQG